MEGFEMKRSHLFIGLVGVLFTLTAVGCVSLSALITPAERDIGAIKFVEDAGIAEPNEFDGFFNLAKAEKLKDMVPMAYEVNMLGIQQAADDQNLKLSHFTESTTAKFQKSKNLEDKLFSETGLLALAATAIGGGSLMGLIGLMRKRPQDITPEDLKVAISGKVTELAEKNDQIVAIKTSLTEVVMGVQDIIKASPDKAKEIKNMLANRQLNSTTKETVALIKSQTSA